MAAVATVRRDASGGLLNRIPEDIRNASFPTTLRGYDRDAVSAYVERVNDVIAELEISRSPQSAVKHALERVGEQASSVLQHAREASDELTAASLAEAEHATRRAKIEAAESVERGESQARELREAAKREAEEILARAEAEVSERVSAAEKRARALHERAEQKLDAINTEIAAATQLRHKILEELRQNAAELADLAGRMNLSGQPPQRSGEDPDQGEQEDGGTSGSEGRKEPSDSAAAPTPEPPTERLRMPSRPNPRASAPKSRQPAAAEGRRQRRVRRRRRRTPARILAS